VIAGWNFRHALVRSANSSLQNLRNFNGPTPLSQVLGEGGMTSPLGEATMASWRPFFLCHALRVIILNLIFNFENFRQVKKNGYILTVYIRDISLIITSFSSLVLNPLMMFLWEQALV
jgi:hypothetical protein